MATPTVLEGYAIVERNDDNEVIHISTQSCRDVERWKLMPPISDEYHSTLLTLDLSRNRYLTQLHSSVGLLAKLQKLILVRCESLEALPESIGNLKALEVLDLIDCASLKCLPESIGGLKR
jgi:Leucine-rich repeat (LRR) protein